MANSIALATKYIPVIDQLYRQASKTAILENGALVRDFDGASAVQILSVATTGLGAYNRNTGYTSGSITATWETHTLSQDRGQKFQLDTMDNDETLGLTLRETMRSFLADKVVPEIDSYRFEKMYEKAGTSVTGTLTDSTAKQAVDAGVEVMDEAEVTEAGRVLFVANSVYNNVKNSDKFSYDVDATAENARDTRFPTYDGMRIIKVPLARFNTAITLSATDGYTQTGEDINFMIVAPNAVFPVVKHNPSNMISPEANQSADAWIMKYRIYHDIFVPANKTKGIYVHAKAAVSA